MQGRLGRRRSKGSWIWLGVLAMLLTVMPMPTLAQSAPDLSAAKAPVVLDGRELFAIGNSGNFTAEERADIINTALLAEVESGKPVDLTVAQDNNSITLRSQSTDRALMTVTQGDVLPGLSAYSQALVWQQDLEMAIRRARLERSPRYVNEALLFAAGVLLAAIAGHFGLRLFARIANRQVTRLLGHPASPLHPWEQTIKLFIQLALLGFQTGLWVAVGVYVTDLFPHLRSGRYKIFDLLNAPVVSLGDTYYSALQLLLLLGFTVGLWFAVRALTRLFKAYVLARTGADSAMQEVIAVLTQYILMFLGLIVLLQIWGLDVGSLAILASVLGVGIGFGLQNIANNFISGLIITLERPIQVGDFVKVGELVGVVDRIGARSTEIRTLDQVTIIVPNSRFLESEVINWNHGNPVSRIKLPLGVAYGSEIERVQAALLEAAKEHPDVLVSPTPQVWFKGFGDSALNFELLVWIGEPKKQDRIKSDLYYRIEVNLRRYGVEVPFPQRDLNVRSPNLEAFLGRWLQDHAPAPEPQLYYPDGATRDRPSTPISPDPQLILPERSPLAVGAHGPFPCGFSLEDVDLTELVAAMQGEHGVEVRDRRYLFHVYPDCFVGSEAVEWLLQALRCSRDEALEVGQRLMDEGFIYHVLDEHPFRDGYFFYTFQKPSQAS
ncbi:mechanosensitive ion channel domain-containing protein [Geitlerinema sp. PCC 7407]|uniref:mechanosensitive ion channel domain-containing protein n=1 Tax=Geitlerinema sp. PCC 7407 TaxID=1173025 RepID=UPI00029FB6FF|nr:mechanosensitive ion channel domain-containing protein [Geitlerinema sp. PCC 7407]AFY67145.1 MscS Mechanosensitive ion channel [Geitlerinema sp. PCC 7407]